MVDQIDKVVMENTSQMHVINSLDALIARLDSDNRTRGLQFEKICEWYLHNDPEYRMQIKKVWLWNKWPERWGADAGIDLVAETHDGKLWAIQAKAYASSHSITKNDLNRFLTESSRKIFSYRLLIATTDRVDRIASRTLTDQEKPVGQRLLTDLRKSSINWPLSPEALYAERCKRHDPLPHQEEAVADVCTNFSETDRGQLIMACGTGKTFVALWVAERLKYQRTLVIVPSLLLLAKTLRDWTTHASIDFHYLPVCSDETVRGEDHLVSKSTELGFPVTTNPDEVASFLLRKGPSVVFVTYQSSSVIADAFNKEPGLPAFDIAIADEAHRCAGLSSSEFATILNHHAIKANKRLFMTATPRFYSESLRVKAQDLECELSSMDDPVKFGPVFHELKFSEAIDQGLLSDYQVAIIGVDYPTYRDYAERGTIVTTDGKKITDARTLAGHIALAKAIRKYGLRRVISFHSRINRAKEFSEAFPKIISWMPRESKPDGEPWAAHISGVMPSGKRDILLSHLGQLELGQYGLVSNARCLGEGVDVPTLDGIAFIDPRGSQIDIIQAVGRAIRKAPNKKIGTIVLPVFISEQEDEEEVLDSSAFQNVWKVLRALRAHDNQLAEKLDQLRLEIGKQNSYRIKLHLPEKIKVDIPRLVSKDFVQAFYIRTVKKTTQQPKLTIPQILDWADAHYEQTGNWPGVKSGPVSSVEGETWSSIDDALRRGSRGLPGSSSLLKLLSEHRGIRNRLDLPPLSIPQILEWADEHHGRTGNWPMKKSGAIQSAEGETWSNVDSALKLGIRSLPGGSTLAKVLSEHCNVRNIMHLPPLTIPQILEWADDHYGRTGNWPTKKSGAIQSAEGETWNGVNTALQSGGRSLPGGSTLAKVLSEYRNVRNRQDLPHLTIPLILKWADEHHERTGNWPNQKSGPIFSSEGDTWSGVNTAFQKGSRGLFGGSTLAKVLSEYRNVRNIMGLPPLSIPQILKWADEHHERTGNWPNQKSGPIFSSGGETWLSINHALRKGIRGLSGGSSLAKLLSEHRDTKYIMGLPPLSIPQILEWADEHHKRTGNWPNQKSGAIQSAEGEIWSSLDAALVYGRRGLPGGSTLAKVLSEYRNVRNRQDLPQLTIPQILEWADEHHNRTGNWPGIKSGPVLSTKGEAWSSIDAALHSGGRGLPGSITLVQLLSKHRGVRNRKQLPPLTIPQILEWADKHHEQTGKWPKYNYGSILSTEGEAWQSIDHALRKGTRGLSGGSSLAKLLSEHRGIRGKY